MTIITRTLLLPLAASLLLTEAMPVDAQTATAPTPAVAAPQVSLLLPNYNSVPVGEVAALEGGAFVARANDTSAGFYNPAGLALADQSSISGSAGAYQFGSVTPEGLTKVKDTIKQIPAMFGVVARDLLGRPRWAGGLTVARAAAWNQAVDAEAVRAVSGDRSDRLRFSTDAKYDAWLVNLGLGYAYSDRLRLGATLDGQYTSISRRQSVTTQSVTSSALSTLGVGTLGNLSTTHLRGTIGAQFKVSSSLQVGAVLRTAGWGIIASGDASLESLAQSGGATAASAFFETEPSVEYRLPFEFKAGAAWIGTRAQAEFDVFTYAGTGQYAAISSTTPVTIVVDGGQGVVTVGEAPYRGVQVDSSTVVNIAVGGRYQLVEGRSWTLHGGYATDRSPVGPEDTGFTKVDLQHITVGVSGRTKLFLGSLGFRYSNGQSAPLGLGPIGDGTFATTFKVSSIGLVYSLALLF